MRTRLKCEHYCVLCHDTLYDRSLRGFYSSYDDLEPWQREMFCFFQLPVKDADVSSGSGPWQLFAVDLNERDWKYGNKSLDLLLATEGLEFCTCRPVCSHCNANRTVNFVHAACLNLATREFPSICRRDLLYQLVRLYRPLLTWRQASTAVCSTVPFSLIPLSKINLETSLGDLMAQTQERLPIEVQYMIYDNVSGLVKSLLRTLSALDHCSHLMPTLEDDQVKTQQMTLKADPLPTSRPGEMLFARTIKLWGETCLAGISTNDDAHQSHHNITIAILPVWGVQVALGTYGVAGLRVLYAGGTKSAWLGTAKRKLFMTCQGNDLARLRLLSDGIKIVCIDFADQESSKVQAQQSLSAKKPFSMLWDHDDFHHHAVEFTHSLIDYGASDSHILYHPKLRLAKYLSLRPCGNYIQCLTIFCTTLGICQIQVNGSHQHSIGTAWNNAVPITFYLKPGEVIGSLFLIAQGRYNSVPFLGPFVMVNTSRGRSLYYGLHNLPLFADTHVSGYGAPRALQDPVVGLFTDPTTSKGRLFSTLGITRSTSGDDESRSSNVSYPTTIRFPVARRRELSFVEHHYTGVFLSKAVLVDVEALDVQRRGDRCTGLCILQSDGHREILGQWDSSHSHVTRIYKADGSNALSTLTFVFSGDPYQWKRYIQDIYVGSGCPKTNNTFTWTNVGSELAWWYTWRFDCVEGYEGTTTELEVTENGVPYRDV